MLMVRIAPERVSALQEHMKKKQILILPQPQLAKALGVAPRWPEGWFNRALILGELKDYGEAAREMKRYLLLVPDAPNARAAQDKIYEWEARAQK